MMKGETHILTAHIDEKVGSSMIEKCQYTRKVCEEMGGIPNRENDTPNRFRLNNFLPRIPTPLISA